MIKNIKLTDGQVKQMGFDENFIEQYIKLGVKTYLQYAARKSGFKGYLGEEEMQDIRVAMFRAFAEYDEKHCFSTIFMWKVKGVCSGDLSYLTANKRTFEKGTQAFSIDSMIDNGEGVSSVSETIADTEDMISRYEDKELIKFILERMTKENDKRYLLYNLNRLDTNHMAKVLNCSDSNIRKRNKVFLRRLQKVIEEYNRV